MVDAADLDRPASAGEVAAPEPVLLRSDAEGVAGLALNRPEAYNALSRELLGALQRELDQIRADPKVRVVVITGQGRAFCAGHDLKELSGERADPTKVRALFEQCSAVMLALTRLPQPVIALVDGIATAAGCQLVAACDLALATTNARFATSGVRYGLFCSTPMVPLSRNLARKPAMEMLLTGDFIEAEDAASARSGQPGGLAREARGGVRCDARAAAEQALRRAGARQAGVLSAARDGPRGGLRVHDRRHGRERRLPEFRGGAGRVHREEAAGMAELSAAARNNQTNPKPAQKLSYDDVFLRAILKRVRTIAAVGMSADTMRPSYFAMLYLQTKGYRVIPVNPRYAGQEILGERVLGSLEELAEPPDMVQIFRRSADVPPVAEAAIRVGAKVLWLQLGVRHDEAAASAAAAGLEVVQDRCPKIEYGRLFGEIGWAGVNRRVISSKKGQALQLSRSKAGFGRKPRSVD